MNRRHVVAAAAVPVCAALLSACSPRQPWSSELVSTDAAGTQSANGLSQDASFSPDGTKLVFTSDAYDLGPTDTNGVVDVYVRDLGTGATTLISANPAGTDSGDLASVGPRFSPDGTKISFTSSASDLVAGGTTAGIRQAYVHDLTSGSNELVSVDATGTTGGNGESFFPHFSPDGTKVVFETRADDLGPVDGSASLDVYVRDLAAGTTTLVSANAAGAGADNGNSFNAFFATGGTKVVYETDADDAVAVDTNGTSDVVVRDLTSATSTLVSANAAGTDSAAGHSHDPAVSPDGQAVVFVTMAGDLGPTDTNGGYDVYRRDLTTGGVTLVSTTDDGTDARGGFGPAAVSPDGTKVVFSILTNDLMVRDLTTGAVDLVSANAAGTGGGNSSSSGAVFSPDGTKVAFDSQATDLGPRDPGFDDDVYLRDLTSGTTSLVSVATDGITGGNGASALPRFSPDGRTIVFRSAATDLSAVPDTNGTLDVFVATLHGADLAVALDATPEPVVTGAPLAYSLEVTNAGPDTADDAALAVVLPEGIDVVDVTTSAGSCDVSPGQPRVVLCELGDLAADGSVEVLVDTTVTAPAESTLEAVAAVSSPTVDPVSRNSDTATSTVVAA